VTTRVKPNVILAINSLNLVTEANNAIPATESGARASGPWAETLTLKPRSPLKNALVIW
ncbi:uncharacterized protein METZ01_LOCUS385660, partial [marine metagenome]